MCPTRVTVRSAKFKQNLKRIRLKGKQNRNYDGIKNEAQNTKPHHEDVHVSPSLDASVTPIFLANTHI